jgi:hypothetical protein
VKYRLYTLVILLVSSNVNAITITEIEPIHFGSVSAQRDVVCVMSQFGVISGACDATDSDIVLGELLVTNLPRNGTVEVVLTGSTNTSLSYVPVAELKGAKGGAVLLYNNQPVSIDTTGNGSDLTITIYGSLTVQGELSLSGAYTTDYTLQVNQL